MKEVDDVICQFRELLMVLDAAILPEDEPMVDEIFYSLKLIQRKLKYNNL